MLKLIFMSADYQMIFIRYNSSMAAELGSKIYQSKIMTILIGAYFFKCTYLKKDSVLSDSFPIANENLQGYEIEPVIFVLFHTAMPKV